jgi:hypothetical protein
MPVSPALELRDDRVVPFLQRQLAAPSMDLGVRLIADATALDRSGHAVHLRVLAEQMRPAEERGVDVPYAHETDAAAAVPSLAFIPPRSGSIVPSRVTDRR